MRRRSRTRRVLKWVGLVGCVVLATVWLVSLRWCISYDTLDPELPPNIVGIGWGCIMLLYETPPDRTTRWEGWHAGRFEGRVVWWPRYHYRKQSFSPTIRWSLLVPAWIPIVIAAVPTAFLWYRDRRPPRGHCQTCGYDLTGNVTGVCPECGETI